MLYCPSCLNQTLDMTQKGVIHIAFNGIQLETGRFLFNQEKEDEEIIFKNCYLKLEDYFKWYKSLKHKDPVKKIQIMSSDFYCSNGCKIPMKMKFTIVDILIPAATIQKQIEELAEKYGVTVDFKLEEEY